jgi:hypothetical protein
MHKKAHRSQMYPADSPMPASSPSIYFAGLTTLRCELERGRWTFLNSDYIEWIARSNRLPGFLTPPTLTSRFVQEIPNNRPSGLISRVSLRNSSSVRTKRRCSCDFYIETIASHLP